MSHAVIKNRKIVDDIVERLEQMILEGVFPPGSRLPAERALAEQFGISRPSLREALKKLTARELITSRQGGGTYVAESVGQWLKDPLVSLYEAYPEAQKDLLEFRHMLETACARYAAQRATILDRERLTSAFSVIEACYLNDSSTRKQEAEADAAFHLAVAEASHNTMLLQVMRMLFGMVRQNITLSIIGLHNYSAETRDRLMQQHRALHEAILDRDPETAQRIAATHIDYVRTQLSEADQEQKRLDRSQRRFRAG